MKEVKYTQISKSTYKILNIKGNTFTTEINGKERVLELKNSRLSKVKGHAYTSGIKTYLKKLSEKDAASRQKTIEDFRKAPPESATDKKRRHYVSFVANEDDAIKYINSQKSILEIRDEYTGFVTVLGDAVSDQRMKLVKYLIDIGVDLQSTSTKEGSILFEVVRDSSPNMELFKLLMAHDKSATKSLYTANRATSTLLMEFCKRNNDIDFLKFLLTLDIDINHKGRRDATALSIAEKEKWEAGVKLLKEHGAK